jgi:cytochrome c oxidase subunit II
MTRLGHGGRILLLWLGSSAIALTLIAIFLTPHLPPGTDSVEATGQRFDNEVLTLVSVGITLGIFAYFGYVLVVFRERGNALLDGPSIRGHAPLQLLWVVSTTVLVLGLAAFGTYELLGGAGGGQGSDPVFVPSAPAAASGQSSTPLQVQVIAQQWQFTYRFPQYGGVETFSLALPVGRTVEFHVTSIDVIHSFWAYQLGVKADAVPGADNIAFATPRKPGLFEIRCAELCGLWHGYMYSRGHVLPAAGWRRWIARVQKANAPATHYLPKYAKAYYPAPTQRGG